MKIIFLCLLAIAFPLQNIYAEQRPSVSEKIIGSTFKTLAKAFVATADIEKIKSGNIKKIRKMPKEKFQQRYAKIYPVLNGLPNTLKNQYNLSENLSREEATSAIESLNKQKIYRIINIIPDTLIASQFKAYLAQAKQKIQESNLVREIEKFWNKIITKA